MSFEGLSLIGCRNIPNKGVIWRELLLLYAGQQIHSAMKGKRARSNSVSGVDPAFQNHLGSRLGSSIGFLL